MNTATYCPEDNKLRLYVGRVPRDEYEALRAAGWTSTPKQDCDFVATWTPSRRDTCLEYAGIIEDEDGTPEDRAADRAERFSGYLDKRLSEATGGLERYESGPSAFGHQNRAIAERAARRFDRVAVRALDSWDKAEYWQRRTAGVISHALHKSTPAVRMGRIKEIEAELRKRENSLEEYAKMHATWKAIAEETDPEKQTARAYKVAYFCHGNYTHPRTGKKSYLYDFRTGEDALSGAELAALFLSTNGEPKTETEWTKHLKLRIAYELQMLEAQGGRAAMVEMEVGGWIGSHQIRKVNKSPATGRVVSVGIMVKTNGLNKWGRPDPDAPEQRLEIVNIERARADIYRAPTEAEKDALASKVKEEKKAAPKKESCPLINPTNEDAEKLQAHINAEHLAAFNRRHGSASKYYKAPEPKAVQYITQAVYSQNSKGTYARAETRGLCKAGKLEDAASNMWTAAANERAKARGPALCKIRICGYDPVSIIVITDKPQKALPAACLEFVTASTVEAVAV